MEEGEEREEREEEEEEDEDEDKEEEEGRNSKPRGLGYLVESHKTQSSFHLSGSKSSALLW